MIDERTSDLIGLIYEAALQPDLWNKVLEEVANITPCAVAALYSHDTSTRTSVIHEAFGMDPFYTQDYYERWAASNPIIEGMKLLDPGQVAGLAQIMDYEAFTRHPFFQEWGRPQNYVDSINVMLERSPTRVASVSLIRNETQGLADPETIARLRVLAPHFLRSIRMGRVFENTKIKEETIAETLNSLSSSVFLVDANCEIVHANTSAHELIEKGLAIGKIKAVSAALRAAEQRATQIGGTAIPDDVVYFIDTGKNERLICHAIPLALAKGPRRQFASLNLIVVENATSTDVAVKTAASMFRLTARERDVLFGLVEGGGIGSTAAMFGLSKETIKSHVRSLFSKTQTHKQSDLVKLVSDLMPPFYKPS